MVDSYKVVSFTETPLNQIYNITNEDLNKYRAKKLQPYGLAVKKEIITSRGGEPAIHLHNKNFLNFIRNQFDALKYNKYSIFHLVNMVSDDHNFYWEREWKIRKGLKFTYNEISYIIVPDEAAAFDIRKLINARQISFYCIPSQTTISFSLVNETPDLNPITNKVEIVPTHEEIFITYNDGSAKHSSNGGENFTYLSSNIGPDIWFN